MAAWHIHNSRLGNNELASLLQSTLRAKDFERFHIICANYRREWPIQYSPSSGYYCRSCPACAVFYLAQLLSYLNQLRKCDLGILIVFKRIAFVALQIDA